MISTCSVQDFVCPLFSNSFELYADFHRVLLTAKGTYERGYTIYSSVPSIGTLPEGTEYCIYRLVLYWDGFQTATGNGASSEGLYMYSLNTAVTMLGLAQVRVLAVNPPGVPLIALL